MVAALRWSVIGLLFALRLPSLTQPAGADQSLYAYVGGRILAGQMPYVDAWDQKPPAIHLLYALLWWLWPDERVVAVADLAAAVIVAGLLITLGRRLATPGAGWLAAGIFALLANPSMHRLGGVFIRAQCETFIALAVTSALVLLTSRDRRWPSALGAGLLLGAAIWLKYNAAVFAVPLALAAWYWRRPGTDVGTLLRELLVVVAGAALLGAAGLGWLAAGGALGDFWLATFTYNVAYSSEGYAGPGAFLTYLISMPFRQARHELLWFLGLVGLPLGLLSRRVRPGVAITAAWIGAAAVAIALNGRDLPQYFVQATPALALSAAMGLQAAWQRQQRASRAVVVLLVLAGLLRVGVEAPVLGGARLAGLPGLASNIRFDLAYWQGDISRTTYLDRFGGQRDRDKFAARDAEELARTIGSDTQPNDTVLVFGFSPAVYLKADRESASRFFWSYPVVREFEAGRPGYGSAGLLAELRASRPAMVVLQKGDWEPDSFTFFMANPGLAGWLRAEFLQSGESRRYVIWRRTPAR